jgi:hypothetical protein
MDLSVNLLLAYLIFGVLGMYVFRYGKQNGMLSQMLIGLGLMLYPYFVSGALLTWAIGILLLIIFYFVRGKT